MKTKWKFDNFYAAIIINEWKTNEENIRLQIHCNSN